MRLPSPEMVRHASGLCLAAIVTACAATVQERDAALRYPTKLVVRQEIVLVHTPEEVLEKRPTSPQTRYYLLAADGMVCEVDFVQYSAVKPDDWVICHWQPASRVRATRPA